MRKQATTFSKKDNSNGDPFRRLSNDLPFSSERQGRLRAYRGREEPRAQPAASRHQSYVKPEAVSGAQQRPVMAVLDGGRLAS